MGPAHPSPRARLRRSTRCDPVHHPVTRRSRHRSWLRRRLIRVWNRATGRQLWEHTAGSDRVFSVGYAPDGEYLASAGRDGLVRFWDPATGRKWAPPIHAHEGAAGLTILPSRLLASGGEDGRVVIVLPSRTRLNRLGTPVGDSETAPAVAVDPSSGTTAVGYNNGLVVLWRIAERFSASRSTPATGPGSPVWPLRPASAW